MACSYCGIFRHILGRRRPHCRLINNSIHRQKDCDKQKHYSYDAVTVLGAPSRSPSPCCDASVTGCRCSTHPGWQPIFTELEYRQKHPVRITRRRRSSGSNGGIFGSQAVKANKFHTFYIYSKLYFIRTLSALAAKMGHQSCM